MATSFIVIGRPADGGALVWDDCELAWDDREPVCRLLIGSAVPPRDTRTA
ncbi:MAG: hypothetical protein ACLP01_02355 [Solirubrobacteraceae bacterium]